MTVLYLAGPMTGLPGWNYQAFHDTAATLRARGHKVINPAENDGGSPHAGDWSYYMRQDLRHLSRADALVMLPGWRNSRGAQLEAHIATHLGMPLQRVDHGQLLPLVQVIGLSGYARTGKDTAAAILADHGWQRASFADRLRAAVLALNPQVGNAMKGVPMRARPVVQAYGWDKAKDSVTETRELLQRMGTEVGRDIFGPDVWVDMALANLDDGGRYVFTDVRFPNEAQAITDMGGVMVRLERPDHGPINGHTSETALDGWPFDAVVVNDGDLNTFATQLREAVPA